jgi:hypothetical protein
MNLDLHGIRHSEVEWIVENHIGKNSPPYEIITGNSNKMKEIVLKILNKHKMKYVIWTSNTGSINVVGEDIQSAFKYKQFKDNGRIVIDTKYPNKQPIKKKNGNN